MSSLLIFGILINTIIFGIIGFRNQKLGIKIPEFLKNDFLNTPTTIIYYLSFLIILLSPEKLWLKIIIILLMQFVINHVLWGIITGIIAGRTTKKELSEKNKLT